MKTFKAMTLGAVAALSLTGAAFAESHAAEVPAAVKARQAAMQLYAFNLTTIGMMAQGKAEYDADAAVAAAENLVKLTSLNAGPMWTPGTSSDDLEASRALPALWENMDDVVTKAVAMNEAAVAMQAAAGGGLESLQGAMGALGGACGACHKAYREPE